MIFAPFPYKILPNSNISSGCIFGTPKFCQSNKDNPKCRDFYVKLSDKKGFYTCPYGFSVERTTLGSVEIIFTCLNIEKKTDKKISRKCKKDIDLTLRLSLNEYENIKKQFEQFIIENETSFNLAANYAKESAKLKLDKDLLDNTIHEIRKLNTLLKSYVTKLSSQLNSFRGRTDYIETLNLDIYSVANLLSIRLDTYDLEVNPELNLNLGKRDIPVYKKIEKVYKCLSGEAKRKGVNVQLKGNSYNLFNARNIIEIAFYIILENAIKYSPINENVLVTFVEQSTKLTLTFKNWGIRPGDDEIKLLTDRNFRSRNVINRNIEEGRGIGLFLLNQICSTNDIILKIKIGDDNRYFDGYRYSPFYVELKFDNMIEGEAVGEI